MGLNIKNLEVERLAGEVARLANESKTEAIRQALIERKARLKSDSEMAMRRRRFDEATQRIWAQVPLERRGSGGV